MGAFPVQGYGLSGSITGGISEFRLGYGQGYGFRWLLWFRVVLWIIVLIVGRCFVLCGF